MIFGTQSKTRKKQIIKNSHEMALNIFDKSLSLYQIEIFIRIEEHVVTKILKEAIDKLNKIKNAYIEALDNERIYRQKGHSLLMNFDLWVINESNYKLYAKNLIHIILESLHGYIEYKIINYYKKEILHNASIIYYAIDRGLYYTKDEFNKTPAICMDKDLGLKRIIIMESFLKKVSEPSKEDLDYLFIKPFLEYGFFEPTNKSHGNIIIALTRYLGSDGKKILKISRLNLYNKIKSFRFSSHIDVLQEYSKLIP
jgi:hypothetical protein